MTEERQESKRRLFVQWFVHLLIIFVCYGQAAPGVNESHYLPKAKHAWDSSFAPIDLFATSHDSHLAATTLAGLMSKFASLPVVAWLGRILSWSLFAWAWMAICRAVRISPILSPLALAAWYFAMHYGHWAGEWAIGGFEAKAIAYPFCLMGVAACLEGRWKSVWLWMGLAMAWHPVVGGWAGLSVGLIWLGGCLRNFRTTGKAEIKSQLPWLACGALISLVGVLPALSGLGGPDRLGKVVASQVQVYLRLAHHMCPRKFESERHVAAVFSLLALSVSTAAVLGLRRSRGPSAQSSKSKQPSTPEPSSTPAQASASDQRDSSERIDRLLLIAWISVGFSICGLCLDLVLATYQPNLASKLLRFYWFRWSDVAVPLAWTLTFWHFVSGSGFPLAETRSESRFTELFGRCCLAVGVGVLGFCIYQRVTSNWQNSVPPADALLVQATGPRVVDTDRYLDWLAVCAWIRENTPTDSLWLTPKYQQTFKWYAHRSEVVCWKDVPQDSASILKWYYRVQTCEPPRNADGTLAEWTLDELMRLHKDYGFGWILVDRTIQGSPPNLEIAYPVNIDNRSFAVFRIQSRR